MQRRRIRKPNYTHQETMILLEQLDLYKNVIFGGGTINQRASVWTTITDAVNSLPNSAGRTRKELQHRWKDLSHRMRLLEKKFQESSSKDSANVSPYYELVMKILHGKTELFNFSVNSPHGSLHSPTGLPVLPDDVHTDWTPSSEIDIKPDKNLLNAMLQSPTGPVGNGCISVPHTVSKQTKSVKSKVKNGFLEKQRNIYEEVVISPDKDASLSHEQILPKNKTKFSPKKSNNRVSHRKTPEPLVKHCDLSPENYNSLQQPMSVPSHEVATTSLLSAMSQPPCPYRSLSMRLDPYTQEVLQMDQVDSDSGTEDEHFNSRKWTNLEGGWKDRLSHMENGGRSEEESPLTVPEINPSSKKRKWSGEENRLQSMSLQELKKIYFIKKIQMVSQRTRCLQLMEEKLEFELLQLRQQPSATSSQRSSMCAGHEECEQICGRGKAKEDNLDGVDVQDSNKCCNAEEIEERNPADIIITSSRHCDNEEKTSHVPDQLSSASN